MMTIDEVFDRTIGNMTPEKQKAFLYHAMLKVAGNMPIEDLVEVMTDALADGYGAEMCVQFLVSNDRQIH